MSNDSVGRFVSKEGEIEGSEEGDDKKFDREEQRRTDQLVFVRIESKGVGMFGHDYFTD